MTVNKPEPTGFTADAATSAIAATPTTQGTAQTGGGPGHQTVPDDSGSIIWSLNLGLLRSSAALLAVFEIAYFILDRLVRPPLSSETMALHAYTVGVALLALALTMSDWFELHWRAVCFVNLLATYGLMLALRLLSNDSEPLFLTLVLTLIGTGALLPWSFRWQLGLSTLAMVTVIIPQLLFESVRQQTAYRWIGVAMAVILGHFILAMRTRYRAELAAWMDSLRANRRELTSAREALSAEVRELEANQGRLRNEIAERSLAQQRLAESEATLRKMFETSTDSIAITRMNDGRFIAVNTEFLRITGYSREEVLSTTGAQLRGFANRLRLRELIQRLRTDGFVRNFEIDVRAKDGHLIPHLVSATLVNVSGEPCFFTILHDISTLKQTERELIAARETALAASEAKSQFLSVMSHEIRTPMNAILGMADVLWETELNAEQRRYLDTMRGNSAWLLNLVNGILDLSRIESGHLSLERADFDLADLAEDVMETLAVRAQEKGLELALRIQPTLPVSVTGDPLRVRQILINLLSNAIKFTEHGEVTLTIEESDAAQSGENPAVPPALEGAAAVESVGNSIVKHQRLHFVVRDTGIGIPADQQQAIFSNFTQADSTVSRKYGGSGLGLAIVKRLVELMDGEITVESYPNKGSTFSFTIALELQPAASARPRVPADAARLAGKRILVVDDSSVSRANLAELLACAGADVAVAADGNAALEKVERARAAGQPYEIVMADNRMPEPDGAAIAQQIIAAAHTRREAIVLMLTVDGLHTQLARLRARGLEESPRCRYLRKPVRRRDLWAALAATSAGDDGICRNGTGAAAASARAIEPITAVQPILSPGIARSFSILLVEDSFDNRVLVDAYLKNTPYRVDHADSGEAAIRKFASGHYDVILMDIQMPVMDGYETAAEIRSFEHANGRRPTPIIALTASVQDEAVRRSSKMGFDAHLTKPIKRSVLLEAIRDAVEPTSQGAPSDGRSDGGEAADTAATTPIVVHVDQDLSDLIPGFLARKRDDASAVLDAVERGDSEALARLGHKMKGEGGSYGLDAITDIGREIEQAGKDGDLNAARRRCRELTDFLERLQIVYRPVEE
jgi:PAS domain S-box-containing protein